MLSLRRCFIHMRRFVRRTLFAKWLHQERCFRRLNAAISRKIKKGIETEPRGVSRPSSNFGE